MLRYCLVPQFDAATWRSRHRLTSKHFDHQGMLQSLLFGFCSAFDLPIDAFNGVVGPDSIPVFSWIVYICASLRYFPPLFGQRQTASFRGVVVLQKQPFLELTFCFLSHGWPSTSLRRFASLFLV